MDSTEEEPADGHSAETRVRKRRPTASVVVLFQAGAPSSLAPIDLRGFDAISFARSSRASLSIHATETGGERRLFIEIPDRKMSSTHAQVRATSEGWCVEDAASRNGTRLNGARIDRGTLSPGDLIEMGHSLISYQSACVADSPPPSPDRDLQALFTFDSTLDSHMRDLRKIATKNIPVLVRGETGTGKELVARAIHRLSGRPGPWRAVNCGALPRSLLESELFGYKKGAFSGATEDRPGLVRSADEGTLFLDEIGDLPLDAQGALLRVLQEGEVLALGAVAPVRVDVRIVAATHRDLSSMVARERFREDLLARLTGFTLGLPPLRSRRADLGYLISQLICRHGASHSRPITFTPAAARALYVYDWPGNVRQLEQVIRTAIALTDSGVVDLPQLETSLHSSPERSAASPPSAGRHIDRALLEQVLTRHCGNVSTVAVEMRTSRSHVHRLCKRFGLDVDAYRRRA